MDNQHRIVGIYVSNRTNQASEVQELLAKYGCNIKTRIGLHETSETCCSPSGLILLELFGETKVCDELVRLLNSLQGLEVQEMKFPK